MNFIAGIDLLAIAIATAVDWALQKYIGLSRAHALIVAVIIGVAVFVSPILWVWVRTWLPRKDSEGRKSN